MSSQDVTGEKDITDVKNGTGGEDDQDDPAVRAAHDALFRTIFGLLGNAAPYLRSVLPRRLAKRLDLSRLAPAPASFVDEVLHLRHADVLYTVPLALPDSTSQDMFAYILMEHQSTVSAVMPFRMLRYAVRIDDHYLHAHPNATLLPAVLPVVVYHHQRRRWRRTRQMLNLLLLDAVTLAAARRFLPQMEILVDDLGGPGDQHQLRQRPLTPAARIALLLLTIARRSPRVDADLQPWTDQLRAILDQPGGLDTFDALMIYIENVSETPHEDLHQLAASLGPTAEERYVTTAEMLRAEGRAEILVKQLNRKFGPLPETVVQDVHAASAEDIDTWAERVLDARTLDEVFQAPGKQGPA